MKNYLKLKNMLILCIFCITVVLITLYFGVKGINAQRSETIVINDIMDKNINEGENLYVKKIRKIELDSKFRSSGEYEWMDENNISYLAIGDRLLINKLDIEKGNIIPVFAYDTKSTIYKFSPDKSKILFQDVEDSKYKYQIYDSKIKKYVEIPHGVNTPSWSQDSTMLINDESPLKGEGISIYNFTTGEKKYIKCKKNSKNYNDMLKYNILYNKSEMKISYNNKKLLLSVREGSSIKPGIYSLDIDDPQNINFLVEAEHARSIRILDDNRVVFKGRYKGQDGIFSLFLTTNKVETLVEGNISSYSISKNKKRIGYIRLDNKGNEVLYVSNLNDNILENTVPVYNFDRISGGKISISWSFDGKKLLVNQMSKDSFILYI